MIYIINKIQNYALTKTYALLISLYYNFISLFHFRIFSNIKKAFIFQLRKSFQVQLSNKYMKRPFIRMREDIVSFYVHFNNKNTICHTPSSATPLNPSIKDLINVQKFWFSSKMVSNAADCRYKNYDFFSRKEVQGKKKPIKIIPHPIASPFPVTRCPFHH